jgi:hypothetical protein
MFGGITFAGAAFAGVVGVISTPLPLPGTDVGITIGGVDIRDRVRVGSLTIHDILNDTPNTATFAIEREAPAVGQRVAITLGGRLLFAGAVQTVDQAYESKPIHRVWQVTAIDDTAAANARRPFGTWVETSATTIAQSLTTTYAPGFATSGIAAGLPAVTIVFDGADTLIACLARLASAVGGYTKIEDRTVYLFVTDPASAPDAINDVNRFLTNPPIQMNTDASQLRTRVYGKGYGEPVTADLAAGASMWPIQDGANFPPLGGTAIAGVTAEGAQSEKIAFTGVVLQSGGSLVGPGSSPTSAPVVQLQGGAGMTDGLHTVSVAYLTATGRSLASPPASITTGLHPAPATAPTANPATPGTGPDQGSHDYGVTFVTAYGETAGGPVSNAITTSAASGQLPAPDALAAQAGVEGGGPDNGQHRYVVTFVNATGETTAGGESNTVTVGPQLVGQTPDVTDPGVSSVGAVATTGGSIEPGFNYAWFVTFTTAAGETLRSGPGIATILAPNNAAIVTIPVSPDPRVTGRKVYRSNQTGPPMRLCATISNNTATSFVDTVSTASIAGNATEPADNTTGNPGTLTPFNRIPLLGIPTGPAGVTGRRLYRAFNGAAQFTLVTTLSNNTATSYTDTTPNASLGAAVPTSNTTGTAVQRIPLANIPIGPPGVTARKVYRRFNGVGFFYLVATIANNTATTLTDSVTNAARGPAAPVPTAIGNQVLVTLPTGASAVTARELYVSPAGGSPRRLIQTIADNTTTQVTVTVADAAITGALEPGADTSGLQQPSGQVTPGSTVLPVAASAPYRPGGGWVILGGGQVVKHTGISGNSLTGIPASGSGAITTTVTYGSQAIPSPMLVGVTGLTRPMAKGSAVHIWIQRDDLLAQQEHAARTGGDGIIEFLIVDQRRGVASLTARCDADLARFSRPIVTVGYATRDVKTRSGKPIQIYLPSQGINLTLTIQDVTITEIGIAPGLAPRFTVQASSVRMSLEDTLRRLIAVGPATVNT